MKLLRTALALSTFSLALAVSACAPKPTLTNLAPPADRLQCDVLSGRPQIPAEYVIDWAKVTTVPQAKAEHDAYVRSIRTREGIVAGYIVELEGRLFACSNNAAWLRDFYKGTGG